ncbi:MAG: protease family protein [Gaiellaceae bacterium]|nr:protease family protein [Gaiellaceae bacterium]
MEDARTRPSYVRLGFWALWVVLFAALNYSERGARADPDVIYKFSTFASGAIFYAIWLGAVLLIAIDRFDLLALRAPRSWKKALGLAAIAAVAIVTCEYLVTLLPLPISPGKEQGLAPTHWEAGHAAAFAANVVLFAVIGPFVEELMFRGLGQSLLRFLGRVPAILLVGIAFGVDHGLVEGLLILIPFGIALAWVRDRTDSVWPGMIVHGLFNGGSLALAVLVS